MDKVEALKLAQLVAKSSNCRDKQVGCVILNENDQLIATSYNYMASKHPHTGAYGIESTCQVSCNACMAKHAEASALEHLTAINRLVGLQEFYKPYKLFCTLEPCAKCQALIELAGIKEVYFLYNTSRKNRQCPEFKGIWQKVDLGEEIKPSLTLVEIGRLVKNYHDTLTWPVHSEENRIENARNIGLALIVEAQEVLQALPWKPWKPNGYKEPDVENLVEELADLLFFTGSMLEIFDLSWSQLEKAFQNKLEENIRRRDAGETI